MLCPLGSASYHTVAVLYTFFVSKDKTIDTDLSSSTSSENHLDATDVPMHLSLRFRKSPLTCIYIREAGRVI